MSAPLLTTKEAAAYLRLHPGTILKLINTGRLTHVRLTPNTIRFTVEQLHEFVEKNAVGV